MRRPFSPSLVRFSTSPRAVVPLVFRRPHLALWLAGLIVAALPAGIGCSLPHDPNGTLDRVRGDTLRVGVTEAPPWVERDGDVPGGVEADLVRRFADDLHAEVTWIWGGEEAHLDALERFQLDLVIGGITESTPWHVGLTNPYFTDTLRVGVPPGEPLPRSLDGLRIAVAPGSALGATLEERDAVAVPTSDLAHTRLPVAAPAWELDRWGFTGTRFELGRTRHVLAVPPGENGWLVRLEDFLRRHASEVPPALHPERPT